MTFLAVLVGVSRSGLGTTTSDGACAARAADTAAKPFLAGRTLPPPFTFHGRDRVCAEDGTTRFLPAPPFPRGLPTGAVRHGHRTITSRFAPAGIGRRTLQRGQVRLAWVDHGLPRGAGVQYTGFARVATRCRRQAAITSTGRSRFR